MRQKYVGDSNTKLNLLSNTKKNEIYDELISHLKAHRIRDDIEYYTKYELAEDCNKKGEKTKEYTFNSIKTKYKSIYN